MDSSLSVRAEDSVIGTTDEGSVISKVGIVPIKRRAGRASRVRRMKAQIRETRLAALAESERRCRENALAWLNELDPRIESFDPDNDYAKFEFEAAVGLAVNVERAKRFRKARRAEYVEELALREKNEALDLGDELFFDPRGPAQVYSAPRFTRTDPNSQTSVKDERGDPALLVAKLESTAAGCRWLRLAWAGIRGNLKPGNTRSPSDNFRMARLMGKQLLDALDIPEVAEVFLASHAYERRERNAFAELRSELCVDEIKARVLRMQRSATPAFTPRDAAEGREWLIAIIDRAQARLRAKAVEYRKRANADGAKEALELTFEDTPEGKSLALDERQYTKAVSQYVASIRKSRGDAPPRRRRSGDSAKTR
jgi:hypothetical protein